MTNEEIDSEIEVVFNSLPENEWLEAILAISPDVDRAYAEEVIMIQLGGDCINEAQE
jgi:acetoin utilization deacetylase AcuC-like enzyme